MFMAFKFSQFVALAAASPAQVQVGVYVSDVDTVNGAEGWWLGEMILTAEWLEADFPLDSPPKIGVVNGVVGDENERSTRHVSGSRVMQTFKQTVKLWFSGSYWLFPFDEQTFSVPVEVAGRSAEEVVLTVAPEPAKTGIRPVNPRTGRHFSTAQFRVVDWDIGTATHRELGMPYDKARATLSIRVRRHGRFYLLDCFLLPSLNVIFACGTFFLPIEPSLPRLVIVFIVWVCQFLNLSSQLMLLPEGVWCWLFSAFGFTITILTVASLANIFSAFLRPLDAEGAKGHDAFWARLLFPMYLAGFVVMRLLVSHHVPVASALSFLVLLVHFAAMIRFYKAAGKSKRELYDTVANDTEADGDDGGDAM